MHERSDYPAYDLEELLENDVEKCNARTFHVKKLQFEEYRHRSLSPENHPCPLIQKANVWITVTNRETPKLMVFLRYWQ
ncbi:hypothetical protein [Salicibibacter cibarius]|uniref:hypothetical protein n=1 Tax=Salicibibacter cibarius TaxID=2743000 RepID=UPI003CCD0A2C